MSRYILFLAKLKRRGRPFKERAKRWITRWDYHQEHLVVIKDEKVRPFVKFEVILPLLCCLLDPLTNKHYSAWSSITLWIDSTTCQKYSILLSARQRSNNYLGLQRKMFWRIWCCHIDHALLESSSRYGFPKFLN